MKSRFLIVCLLLLSIGAGAVPARRGWQTRQLADGTTVQVQLVGDEFYHYWVTPDGKRAQRQEDGSFIVLDEAEPAPEQVRARREAAMSERPRKVIGTPTLAPRGLVILVNFADLAFQAGNDSAAMSDMMNKTGYDYNGATGSARDYFITQSDSQYMPDFDIIGPVTLPHNYAYYGANVGGEEGKDQNPRQMIIDACAAVEAKVDFTKYDDDDNGDIDFVYVIYAGYGEADGGDPSTVWPHFWTVNTGDKFDGKTLYHYTCSAELDGLTGDRTPIGTPCHEFSHFMGLPDYYDTNTKNGYTKYYTPNEWSLMDYGCYNNGGNTPCNYSLYDKEYMGWIKTVKTFTKDQKANVTLTTDYYDGYKIDAGSGVVYYLENRQLQNWDKALYQSGMLTWRVRYDASVWSSNTVNDTKDNLHYTVETANGDEMVGWCYKVITEDPLDYDEYHFSDTDPYPGAAHVTTWDKVTGFTITDITEKDGKITFKMNGGDPATGVQNTDRSADEVQTEKLLQDGQILIRRGQTVYTLTGTRIQ